MAGPIIDSVLETPVTSAEQTLRALHEVTTSPQSEFPQQITDILQVGCRQLGLPFGAASRVRDDKIEVRFVVCPNNEVPEGTVFELCDTFCTEVMQSGNWLAIQDAANSEWRDHLAHKNLGLTAYIGAPLQVDGEKWGTACFFDFSAKATPFTDTDVDLLGLIATRIQVNIEHDSALDGLRTVISSTAGVTGEDFFKATASHVAGIMHADFALVAECLDTDNFRARTLSHWIDGQFVENHSYDTHGTPCEDVLDADVRYYPTDVQAIFPASLGLLEHNLNSVAALCIRNSSDNVIGHLVCASRGAMALSEMQRWLLKMFAARAGAELERMRVEAERRRLEREVLHGEKLKSLGVLTGGIAHDFNNLLTGILGNATLVLDKLGDSSPAVAQVEQIEQAARRAANLTKEMLAYSGRGDFTVELVDMNAVVAEMSALLQSAIAKTVSISKDFSNDLRPISADATQLRQIVMNLIMNASDACQCSAGHMTLRTYALDLTEASIRSFTCAEAMHAGSFVCLEVEDDGVGMDTETVRQMFDPFFSTKESGSGLGLSATLGIVRAHHGGIEVDSTPGGGTRVRVVFPVEAMAKQTVPSAAPALSVVSQQPSKVLVVDDEALVRMVVVNSLEAMGLDVVSAPSGPQAIELAREHAKEISLAIVDVNMPGMDGHTVATALREIVLGVPILMMSGYDEQQMSHHDEGNVADEFLQKPFEIEVLQARTRAYVGTASS